MHVVAYLDPGSGSIVLQAVLGGIGGIALLWARMRHRVRAKLGRGETAEAEQEAGAEDEPGAEPGAGTEQSAERETVEEPTAGQ